MDNYTIADQFSLLGKLMDIHGENAFKSKSYTNAAFIIERLPQPLSTLSEAAIGKIKGIGESVAKKVLEIVATGGLETLQKLVANTPEGVLEMMNIKGLGPKKINTLWKEFQIDTIADLETACAENRIAKIKGFGEKTEQKIAESIAFVRSNKGYYLYKQVEEFVTATELKLAQNFPADWHHITGEFRRQSETINKLEWVSTATKTNVIVFFEEDQFKLLSDDDDMLIFCAEDIIEIRMHLTDKKNFYYKLATTGGSEEFLIALTDRLKIKQASSEEELFSLNGLAFIPPYLRERKQMLQNAGPFVTEDIVTVASIKGLIHSHSNWSDGAFTIEQMAEELIEQGFQYLVISDHSKAAGYANGLPEERIKEQHLYIDELNKKFHPFKIFKSIECDILGDGKLDYSDEVLASFDLVITSIHSNLDMEEDKAMMRLLGAINNPYTTILGHMTGRLLLTRKGYPVNHKAIIDACAKNSVVIEINAAPKRLDIDWRWIEYALEKGVMLSINPDAHALDEFKYIKYGVLVAQKGALPIGKNLSSFSLKEFEAFLAQTKKKKGLLH